MNNNKQGSSLHFIAIAIDGKSAHYVELLRALTPRLMKWSSDQEQDVWLLDMRPVSSYWNLQARRRSESLFETLRHVLDLAQKKSPTPHQTVHGVAAATPWIALLLALHMRERQLPGYINAADPATHSFALNMFKDITWDTLLMCVSRLGEHFRNKKRRHFHEDSLRKQCSQILQAAKRLGMHTPWMMRTMEPAAIRRRFGSTLQEVWEWTFGQNSFFAPHALTLNEANPSLEQDDGFPWMTADVVEVPAVTRHLDYPLTEWDHIEPVLKEDLDRLCDLGSWDTNERILCLEWRLVFPDLTCLCVPILFRHPHFLRQEKGLHKTALLQARYSFDAAIPGSQLDIERLDEHLPTMPIVSWHIAITERIAMPPVIKDIFGGFSSGFASDDPKAHPFAALVALENKLPHNLEAYDLKHDWLPEDSFSDVAARERSLLSGQNTNNVALRCDQPTDNPAYQSLRQLGLMRPLFLYKTPEKLPTSLDALLLQRSERNERAIFCERTMDKWWRSNAAHQRDYYWMIDSEQRGVWVFRNNIGQTYVQGIYS